MVLIVLLASAFFALVPAPAASAEIKADLDIIERVLKDKPSMWSKETFLLSLPQWFRSYPVILYSSRSLQHATDEFPRVIFSDLREAYELQRGVEKQSHLLLAFNSENVVELIQYRPDGSFEFAELEFGKGGASLVKHPATCQRCHGNPAIPIWDAYPFWPGSLHNFDRGLNIGELRKYRSFYSKHSKELGYQSIVGLKSPPKIPLGLKISDLEETKFFVTQLEDSVRVNTKRLAFLLTELHGSYLQWVARHTKHKDLFREIAIAHKVCGLKPAQIIPPEFHHSTYSQVEADTDFRMRVGYLKRILASYRQYYGRAKSPLLKKDLEGIFDIDAYASYQAGELFGRGEIKALHFGYSHEPEIADLRYLLEWTGFDVKSLSMSFYKDEYDNPRSSSRGFFEFLDLFLDGDSKAKQASSCDLSSVHERIRRVSKALGIKPASTRFANKEVILRKIRDHSIEEDLALDGGMNRSRSLRQILSLCMSCHSTGEMGAPDIHFSKPALFAEEMRHGDLADKIPLRISERGRMRMPPPPLPALGPKERRLLIEYMKDPLGHR